jgi:hypothetical protein
MKYIYIAFIVSIFINSKAFAQSDSLEISRNLLYVEVGGAGGYGSVNYERVLSVKNKFMFTARLGLSSYHIKDFRNKFNPDILIPLAINGSYGKNHRIELGLGQTLTNIVLFDFSENKMTRRNNFHTFLSIGYRYQKSTGGMFFRFAYNQIFEFNEYLNHWAGISFGYSF